MDDNPDWIITTIDGKISSISADFRLFAEIAEHIAVLSPDTIGEIRCAKISTEEVMKLSETARWDDFRLFGTRFQKMVWKKLFSLTHDLESGTAIKSSLLSYSDFAAICGNRAGVRAVAHAVGQNPVAIIIPCHLIVPKETMDRIRETERQAEASLFGKDGLRLDPTLDFGEYRYGKEVKKRLITGI